MMKKIFFIGILMTFFYSSEAQNKISERKCEQNLRSEIKKGWLYHSDGNYYEANKKFIEDIISGSYPCIFGKDTSYISKLLGNQYQIDVTPETKCIKDSLFHSTQYNISPYEPRKRNGHLTILGFCIDKNGIVRMVAKYTMGTGWIE